MTRYLVAATSALGELEVPERLAAFDARVAQDPFGRAQLRLQVTADSLHQAVVLAGTLLVGLTDLTRVEVVSPDDQATAVLPGLSLASVTEVANEMGLTRQAVLARIAAGRLPAVQVGRQWVVLRSYPTGEEP